MQSPSCYLPPMAAWAVVAAVMGCLAIGGAGALVGMCLDQRREMREIEDRLREMMKPQKGDGELMERVLERLLGAVVPEPEKAAGDGEIEVRGDAEHEPPEDDWVGAQDWTDPFIGQERPLVGRLAPGQGIPSGQDDDVVERWREQGVGAFDDWARETLVPEGPGMSGSASWVAPIDLGDGRGEIE